MFKPPVWAQGEAEVTMERSLHRANREAPFRLLILGDFSSRPDPRASKNQADRAGLRPIEIDRDNLDEVMARLNVGLRLVIASGDAPEIEIEFKALEDFHPDRLFDRLDIFQSLRQTRQQLHEPATFAAAAARVSAWAAPTPAITASEPRPQSSAAPITSEASAGGLLEQVLEAAESRAPQANFQNDELLQALLRDVVKPYLVSDNESQRVTLVACVDEAIGSLMRRILHDTKFQALEAAWRALDFLVSRLETSAELRLYLLDLSKGELAGDLFASDDLQATDLYKLLVEEAVGTPGGEPWSAVIGDYRFDRTRDDAELLGRIGRLAEQAGAPFIAEAGAQVLGCESLIATPDPREWQSPTADADQEWQHLRRQPESVYLGLSLPRFLLRLPYGAKSDPLEQFDFEEMATDFRHDALLWGNPAFACAYLLSAAYNQYGADFRPGLIQEIDDLPLYVYQEDGESQVKPCAEVWLTERAAEAILNRGIMPLLSFRGRAAVRLARFQSVAAPLAPLAGRWSH